MAQGNTTKVVFGIRGGEKQKLKLCNERRISFSFQKIRKAKKAERKGNKFSFKGNFLGMLMAEKGFPFAFI